MANFHIVTNIFRLFTLLMFKISNKVYLCPMKNKLKNIALGIFTLALLFTFVWNILINLV